MIGATLPPPSQDSQPPLDLLTDVDDEPVIPPTTNDDDTIVVDTSTLDQESDDEAIPNRSPEEPRTPVTQAQIPLEEDPLNAESLQDESTGVGTGLSDNEPPQVKQSKNRPKGSKSTLKHPEPQAELVSDQVAYSGPSTRSRTKGGSAHITTLSQATAFYTAYSAAVDDDPDIVPITYDEAISGPEADQWKAAMAEELQSLDRNKTWRLVKRAQLRRHTKVLGGRWVFRKKTDLTGKVVRHKARWVVKGYLQRYGRDYTQTYAGVAKSMTWKVIIAMATKFDWEIDQMDVVTAFLNGDADEEIYMDLPPGFTPPPEHTGDNSQMACRLIKALYGLKQSPRLWQLKLRSELHKLGFTTLAADEAIYRHPTTGLIIITYVDDFLIIGPKGHALDDLKMSLMRTFDMTDLGAAKYFLGIQITRDRPNRTLSLSQDAYVDKIIKRFGMEHCKPVATPMATGSEVHMVPHERQALAAEVELYQQMIGSQMYLATQTRPDLAYTMSALSRYLTNPSPDHFRAAKHVFRYLQGTKTNGITFGGQTIPLELHGYSDSAFADDIRSRRSTTAYVFLYYGGVISYRSKRLQVVALSSTEAEYYALGNAAREAAWLRQLFLDLGVNDDDTKTVRIYGDNQSSLSLTENPVIHQRTKHVDVQHHYVRSQVALGKIELWFVSTDDMAADGLTKALKAPKHRQFMEMLAIHTNNGNFNMQGGYEGHSKA